MKWLPLLFFAFASIGSSKQAGFTPTAELGNIMYVGDSITHGVDSASYRWPLFKIWVDNGISHREVGVNAGNWRGGVPKNTPYGGATFLNVHSAISSERAYEIAGRINKSGRLENSNIHDWLGLDESYKGKRRIDPATQMPDTFIMLIGTNDTLSDSGKAGIHSCMEEKQQNLLGARRGKAWKREGDLYTIISAMRAANPGVRIAVCTIPTWMSGRNNNDAPADYAAIERYNSLLKSWAKGHKVAVVEVNRGLVDVTRRDEKPFVGVASMFVRDRLHPSAQGDLIIAGNIAQQLGYAGRTAGLPRKAAWSFPLSQAAYTLHSGSRYSCKGVPGDGADGLSAEFRFAPNAGFGDGARRGWDRDQCMEARLATPSVCGTLSLSEGYLSWNGRVLYSADVSQLREPVRMAWVAGNAEANIPAGFYVWLGDRLIGEALAGEPRAAEAAPSFTLCNPEGASAVTFEYIGVDLRHSWAPPREHFSAASEEGRH